MQLIPIFTDYVSGIPEIFSHLDDNFPNNQTSRILIPRQLRNEFEDKIFAVDECFERLMIRRRL